MLGFRTLSDGHARFLVDVTVFTDRDGFYDSGDCPLMWIEAKNADDAIKNVRAVIGIAEGHRYPDRATGATVTRVFIVARSDDESDESASWDSLDDRDSDTDSGLMRYRLQYCDDGYDSDNSADFPDATEVRAWSGAHGDELIVSALRTKTNRWRIESSDIGHRIPMSAYRRRFDSPLDVVKCMAELTGRTAVRANCRCGVGGQCD